MEKEEKLYEFIITFINEEEDCEDIEIVDAKDKENAEEIFIENFGFHKIKFIEKI